MSRILKALEMLEAGFLGNATLEERAAHLDRESGYSELLTALSELRANVHSPEGTMVDGLLKQADRALARATGDPYRF